MLSRRHSGDARQRLLAGPGVAQVSLPLYRKVPLVAAMAGVESILSFRFLYEVPLLQMLGVPVTFSSLYNVLTSPAVIALLALLGRFTDRGPNHMRRKICGVFCVLGTILLGVVLVIVASLALLSGTQLRPTALPFASSNASSQSLDLVNCSTGTHRMDASSQSVDIVNCSARTTQSEQDTSGEPSAVTATLGVIGFAFIAAGCDLNIGVTRACFLACSSSSEHTSLLVLALVLAALGGCTVNGLGLLDLSRLLPVGDAKSLLVAQSTLTLTVCGVLVILMFTSTMVSAMVNISTCQPLHHSDPPRDSSCHGAMKNSRLDIRQNESGADTYKSVTSSCKTSDVSDEEANSSCERLPLIDPSRCPSLPSSRVPGWEDERRPGVVGAEAGAPPHAAPATDLAPDTQVQDASEIQGVRYWSWNKHKRNFVVACAIGFLSFGTLNCFIMYATDFLGKVVMGGESAAAHHTAAFSAYSRGVGLGPGGLLTVYCSFLLFSLMHKKMLSLWGLRVDMCLALAVMAVSVLTLVMTGHVGMYYVSCAAHGLLRSAAYTVPYVIANDFARQQEKTGGPATGRVMAIISSVQLTNLGTLYALSGPLVHLTSSPGAPLVLASCSATLACVIFFLGYSP